MTLMKISKHRNKHKQTTGHGHGASIHDQILFARQLSHGMELLDRLPTLYFPRAYSWGVTSGDKRNSAVPTGPTDKIATPPKKLKRLWIAVNTSLFGPQTSEKNVKRQL